MSATPGLPVRRAALRLLDAVFRRGETLEQAEGGALGDIRKAPDRALAKAIAGETLRWLTDLDALIDSATKQNLPDDAKARMVLRIMLAQALRLDTPPHAVIATGLPLLAGGPRRLAHGVFSALVKPGVGVLPEVPTLPEAVVLRWGADKAAAIAPGLAFPPELDLALKDAAETETRAVAMGGVTLAPGHVRLPRGAAVESLADYKAGDWWVQDAAAAVPVRLLAPKALKRPLGRLNKAWKQLQRSFAGSTRSSREPCSARAWRHCPWRAFASAVHKRKARASRACAIACGDPKGPAAQGVRKSGFNRNRISLCGGPMPPIVASLLGIVAILAIAFVLSNGKRRISLRIVGSSFALQALLAFIVLMLLSSIGVFSPPVVQAASDASRGLRVVAIAAAGVKTSFEELLKLGWQPVLMLVGETLFIGVLVLGAVCLHYTS